MERSVPEIDVAQAAHQMRRIPQLDSLRGLLLVWMTVTHLPTRVSAYSNQVVGFVSAAEGFILLAALLTGRIQRRATETYGPEVARRKLFQRISRIYSYHLMLLGVAFGLCAGAAVYLDRVPLQNLLDFYLERPKTALIGAPLLLYNPPLLDILPIYIIFMLLTPLLLWAAGRWGWLRVLSASACVWLLAQCNLRAWIYSLVAHAGFPIPLREMGAFDIFAWQLLWTAGLALGEARLPLRWPKWVVVTSGTVAAALFICRHTPFDKLTGPVLFDLLIDKWKLGVLRLVNATAIGILLVRFGPSIAGSRFAERLAVLGRASLEVFATHLIFCFFFLGVGNGPEAHLPVWEDLAIVGITIAGLFVAAITVGQSKAGASSLRPPAVATNVPS
jgi:hypothetical protein